MKKLSAKWYIRQAIAIKREYKCKKRKVSIIPSFDSTKGIIFPPALSLQDKKTREILLKAIKLIKNKDSTTNNILYFDFNKVETLYAPATVFFAHVLEQYQNTLINARASKKSNVVRAMMTKLGLSQRLKLAPCYSQHEMMNWYTFSGNDLTFGNDYLEIEKVLEDNLSDETFLIVNDAISEAVSNVINHAYEKNQRHLTWKVALKLNDDNISIVITDLGKTIPATVPDKIDDHAINRLSNIFDFSNFLGMDDAQLIDIASEFRRTSTKEKHRGKGFGNMLEVCKTVKNSQLIVYSRKGIWKSKGSSIKKMLNYKDQIDGTIIFWKLPLNTPSNIQTAA